MKNQLFKLGSICIALSIVGNAMGQAAIKTGTFYATETAPYIDGVAEDLWAGVEKYAIERPWPDQSISMSDGAAPTWQACWDEYNTYVLITVPDDHQYSHVEALVGSWLADKPELYFDINTEKVEDPALGPTMSGSGHFQFASDFTSVENPPTNCTVAFTIDENDKGYIFEYAIPHASMYDLDGKPFEPHDGLVIGFDITLLDLDAEGKGLNTDIGRANWSNDMLSAGESWNDMTMSGDVTYSGTPIDSVVADFSAAKTLVGLEETVIFSDLSLNYASTWLWNFGDGSTSQIKNPYHAYAAPGVYTVSLTVSNSKNSDSITKTNYIVVNANRVAPVAEFYCSVWDYIMIGETVTFTDNSLNTPIEWLWDFGDGNTSVLQNPSHIFNESGAYTVALKVKNSIGTHTETKADFIIVQDPIPVASFLVLEPNVEIGKPVSFIDQSTNNPTNWYWNFGDGTTATSQNPVHIYTSTGSFTVTLTVTNNLGSTSVVKDNFINIYFTDIKLRIIEKKVQIFPNPSTGVFNLKVDKNSNSELSVQIIDANGKVVYTKNKISDDVERIDLSGYSKGIYFMQLSGSNYLQTEKLIIN